MNFKKCKEAIVWKFYVRILFTLLFFSFYLFWFMRLLMIESITEIVLILNN